MVKDAALPEIPDKLAKELRKVDKEAKDLRARAMDAAQRKNDLIVKASEESSQRRVAKVLGVSPGRIQQIVTRQQNKND